MGKYNIQWRSSVRKDLRNIPSNDITRILSAIEKLADDPHPHGSQKIVGSDHTYRIRIGDYRVVYEVLVPNIIEIERVAHRKDVYR